MGFFLREGDGVGVFRDNRWKGQRFGLFMEYVPFCQDNACWSLADIPSS
jgi:hypothetical protein